MKLEIARLKQQLREEKAKPKLDFLETILQSEKSRVFYTGLNSAQLEVLWKFLKEEAGDLQIIGTELVSGQLKGWSLEKQFYLFLVKLRRDFPYADFEYRFGLKPQNMVGRIFKTWLQFVFYSYKVSVFFVLYRSNEQRQ